MDAAREDPPSPERVEDLYRALKRDAEDEALRGLPPAAREALLHRKHHRFAMTYPGLFFKIVRGSMDEDMLLTLLALKRQVDREGLSLEDSRNRVVDLAREAALARGDPGDRAGRAGRPRTGGRPDAEVTLRYGQGPSVSGS